jgi:hypothetical protein
MKYSQEEEEMEHVVDTGDLVVKVDLGEISILTVVLIKMMEATEGKEEMEEMEEKEV